MAKVTIENPGHYLSENYRKNLDAIRKYSLGQKYDYVIVIAADKSGVGLGKSVLAQLTCAYADPDNFDMNHVLFNAADYKMAEESIKPLMAYMFDEPDAFFSTEAMTRESRDMKIEFAKIRQKQNLIVICSPSLLLLSKWFRGTGQTRINCVIRVVRRGVFYAYGDRSGRLGRIRIDTANNKVIWPECDFIGFFRKIPEKSAWWKAYTDKKNDYLKQTRRNPKAVRLMKKEMQKRKNTLTYREIAEIQGCSIDTVRGWARRGIFSKRGMYTGPDGKKRIIISAYNVAMKKLTRLRVKRGRPRLKVISKKKKKSG